MYVMILRSAGTKFYKGVYKVKKNLMSKQKIEITTLNKQEKTHLYIIYYIYIKLKTKIFETQVL